MRRLLIIDKEQFGYLTDVYKWCEFLRNEIDITVLSSDCGRPRINLEGINVIYVSFGTNPIINAIKFFISCCYQLIKFKGKVIVIYFKWCSIIKRMFPQKDIQLDIRTLAVFEDAAQRHAFDSRLREDAKYFDTVSVISKGVAEVIGLMSPIVIPLGGDPISMSEKDYINGINILYVGTFCNRRLEDTLRGVKIFIDENPNVSLHYDIVGDGLNGELEDLKSLTAELHLTDHVTFHGYLPHSQLKPLYDRSNIGICYVPITDYYQYQPPTKTFEYILSGLFCMATDTYSNRQLITPNNGVLINDSPEGVKCGVNEFLKVRNKLKESTLRDSLSNYNWRYIVTTYVRPLI